MKTKSENPGVLYPDEEAIAIGAADIAHLKQLALLNPMKRARLCTHRSGSDTLHEMLIVIARGSYIRPHKHRGQIESFSILEGEADLFLFDDAGRVTQSLALGSPGSGKIFYHRLDRPIFHTVRAQSEFVLIHEVTEGPFDRERTVFPDWAPNPSDIAAAQAYNETLPRTAP